VTRESLAYSYFIGLYGKQLVKLQLKWAIEDYSSLILSDFYCSFPLETPLVPIYSCHRGRTTRPKAVSRLTLADIDTFDG